MVASGPSSPTAKQRSRARRARATAGSTRPGSMRLCGGRCRLGPDGPNGGEEGRDRAGPDATTVHLGFPGQEQHRCNDQRDRCKGGERHEDERSAAAASSAGRYGDDPSLGRPGGGERTRIEDTASEELLGRDAFGLGFGEVGGQVGRHLHGEWIGDTEAFPLPAALLDEITHEATSTLTGASTASTASRAARHSDTPSASASRPALEGR